MSLVLIGLVGLAVLVALWSRCHEARRNRFLVDSGSCKSFDTTAAELRLARVRRDYLAVICARSRDRTRRARLHAQACRTVRARAYFHRETTAGAPRVVTEADKSPG